MEGEIFGGDSFCHADQLEQVQNVTLIACLL